MFRIAVTSAKKVKTTLKLSSTERSIAYSALKIIKSKENISKALVIGNGEIGRLMASILIENGYDTTITLRRYRHGDNIIPLGAKAQRLRCCNQNRQNKIKIFGQCGAV